MKRLIATIIILPALLFGGHRLLDLEPSGNTNGWTERGDDGFVRQSFILTCDSLKWVSLFIGAPCSSRKYNFEIRVANNGPQLYYKENVQIQKSWDYMPADLGNPVAPLPPKGTLLELKVKGVGDLDSINWYAATGNQYAYGQMTVPNRNIPSDHDLACRVEGINRPVSDDFFGVHTWTLPFAHSPDSLQLLAEKVSDAGSHRCREGLGWNLVHLGVTTF